MRVTDTGTVTGIAFRADGFLLATTCADETVGLTSIDVDPSPAAAGA
ncbi:MAG TPA: hypothetical protein VGL80_30615 [Pseudonocardiaceae bacterium]|jgi:hypothetical protein